MVLLGVFNEVWLIDFVMDVFFNGWCVKCLIVVDDFMKEVVDIVVDYGILGLYVVWVLDCVVCFCGYFKVV